MIKTFNELKDLSKKYNVPEEDVLFIDMNLSGLMKIIIFILRIIKIKITLQCSAFFIILK